MTKKNGTSVSKGIAIGKINFLKKNSCAKTTISDIETEKKRFDDAASAAKKQLDMLCDAVIKEAGEKNAEIFSVHAMMLEDRSFVNSVYEIIESEMSNAEYAVSATGDKLAETFASLDDEVINGRSTDIKDISWRVVQILQESEMADCPSDEPAIVMTEELLPSEIIKLGKSKLKAFVTSQGSKNSHAALLARAMGIPALVDVQISDAYSGKLAIVDCELGKLIIDPDDATLFEYQEKKKLYDEQMIENMQLKDCENVTKSGKSIRLCANVVAPTDVESVLDNGADGIGLLRSEFLFIDSKDYPTEDEQFEVYKKISEAMGEKLVVIRTLDIGADKQAGYLNLDKENNPALGYRGVRISLSMPDIFRTQLRAIYRASAYGNIAIMYPMIISVDEVIKIKEISESVRKELLEEGIEIGSVLEGIMIETPAAAIVSDELAKQVDFFSIGTNDLTQYTLAVDRQNQKLEPLFDSHHPAILKLIKMVVNNAHSEDIWVSICGELATDVSLTEEFIKMGVDELSVPTDKILDIRKAIRACK